MMDSCILIFLVAGLLLFFVLLPYNLGKFLDVKFPFITDLGERTFLFLRIVCLPRKGRCFYVTVLLPAVSRFPTGLLWYPCTERPSFLFGGVACLFLRGDLCLLGISVSFLESCWLPVASSSGSPTRHSTFSVTSE